MPIKRTKQAPQKSEASLAAGLRIARTKQLFSRQKGCISRFADPSLEVNYEGRRELLIRRRYHVFEIRNAMELVLKHGIVKASKIANIPAGTLHSWRYRSALPETGRNSFAKMVKLVQRAKQRWQRAGSVRGRELPELFKQAELDGVSIASLKVFLSMETLPAARGFILYTDPQVQLKCEEMSAGRRRGNDIYEMFARAAKR